MTYNELLNTTDWNNRREEILDRDKSTCQACLNTKYLSAKSFKIGWINEDQIWNRFNEKPIKIEFSDNTITEIFPNFYIGQELLTLPIFKYEHTFINFVVSRLNYDEVHAIYLVDKLAIEKRQADYKKTGILEHLLVSSLYRADEVTWCYVRNLHVHHKYYMIGLKPWQYPDDALQTLCWSCHEELHKNERIPVYNASQEKIGELTPCSRCFGTGYFPEYEHVQGGVCFRCNGLRYEEFMQ